MAQFTAGGFAVPGSTGNHSVAGLGFQPQGVLFFGGNQATEDAVVNNANAGAFRGLMADDGAGTILAEAVALIPAQGMRASGSQPILQQSSFNTLEYQASPVSFDADGFTVNFTQVAANRWVHYLAWGDASNWEAARCVNTIQTLTIGWLAKSMIHVGCLQSGGGTGDYIRPDLSGYTFGWWGSGSYPSTLAISARVGSSLSLIRYPWTGQINTRLMAHQNSNPIVSTGAGFLGPFLSEPQHRVYPIAPDQLYEDFSGGFQNMSLVAAIDAEADGGIGTPSSSPGGASTQTLTNLTHADVVLLYGANGWESGPGVPSSGQAVGFGVYTDGYQGCVMVNQGNYLYQSRTKSWCANVQPGGVNAGTIDNTPVSAFDLVSDVAAVAGFELAWTAFVSSQQWTPHIYRWLKR